MTICRSCSGEAVKVVGDKSVPRDCNDCVAQSLIKHKNNTFGIMPLEHAKKLCSCLANNHNGEKMLPSDGFIDSINTELRESQEKNESEIPENIYSKKKQKEIDYYVQRVQELKELDEQVEDGVFGDNIPEYDQVQEE